MQEISLLVISLWNELEANLFAQWYCYCFYTVQLLLYNIYNSSSTLLICLHPVKWFQIFLCIAKNSIKYQSFVYTKLNDQTVLGI